MQAVRRCWSQRQISVRQEESVLSILHNKGSTTDNYHFKIVSVPQVALQSVKGKKKWVVLHRYYVYRPQQ